MLEQAVHCTGTVYTSRIEIRVKTYQVRIGTDGTLTDPVVVFTVVALNVDDAEQIALYRYHEKHLGTVRYVSVSVA